MGCQPLLQGNLPKAGIETASLLSPALAGRFLSTSASWEALSSTLLWMKDTEIKKEKNLTMLIPFSILFSITEAKQSSN